MPNLKRLEPDKIIIIGASTGGPGHIQKILAALKPDFSASIVIAQHMGNEYIPSFVKQLNSICRHEVIDVSSEQVLLASHIYVGSLLTSIKIDSRGLSFSQKVPTASGYNPDINYLFASAAKITHQVTVLGIILTGIGNDGVNGCRLLFEKGAECIAESESSAIVDGMPMQARNTIKGIKVLSLNQVINKINLFGSANV
jgi:two-component system, chemotaxis family, protein-glutamate methylesterase/glutaminase